MNSPGAVDLAAIESRCHTSVDEFDRYMRYVAPELSDMGVYDPALWQTALDKLKRSISESFEVLEDNKRAVPHVSNLTTRKGNA